MLKYNGRTAFVSVNKFVGAYTGQNNNVLKAGGRNRNAGGFNQTFSAYPNGNLAPSSFILPQKSGSISSYTLNNLEIDGSGNLVPARNLVLSASSVITVSNAQLDQIVSGVVSGTLTIEKLNAILAGAANAQLNGTLNLTSNISAGAIFSVSVSANGSITGAGSTLTALANMEADIGGPTPLSPEGLANAVWNSIASDNNDPGTMGEKLNDAGAAGNPWSALLVDNNTSGTFGWFVQKLLTVAKFLGLK
jgi:hypothetical protein